MTLAVLALLSGVSACQSETATDGALQVAAAYNRESGRLETLTADQDGDGRHEIIAYMDGIRLMRIEIDRDGDGRPDRWEYYDPGTTASESGAANPFDRWAVIARAEESDRRDQQITRREFYERGRLQRVEEDVNLDGRADKWERYRDGRLVAVDLDLNGTGVADRRLVYGPGGDVVRIETDRDGDGTFEPLEMEVK